MYIEKIVVNIVIALIGLLYWYVNGDVWPAVLGSVFIVLVWDEVNFLVIAVSAAIIALCGYFFWTDLVPKLVEGPMLKEMGVTVLFMAAAFFKAFYSFR